MEGQSILIKNAQVVDGKSQEPVVADVFIKGGKILAMGIVAEHHADTIIDGENNYLTPGLIEVEGGDHTLEDILANPRQEDYRSKGITTVIAGGGGRSVVPMFGGMTEKHYNSGYRKINYDWVNFDDYKRALEKNRWGVNFYTLMGHDNVAGYPEVVSENIEAGAKGVSFGWHLPHRPVFREEGDLAREAFRSGGLVVARSDSHNFGDRRPIWLYFLREKRKAGKGILMISHINQDDWNYLERSRALGEVVGSFNPEERRVGYLREVLPLELTYLNNQALVKGLNERKKDYEKTLARLKDRDINLVSSYHPFNYKSSLADYASSRRESFGRGLASFLNKYGSNVLVEYKRKKEVDDLINNKNIFLTSGGSRRDVFGNYLREAKDPTELSQRVKKLTSEPARTLRLNDLHTIEEGAEADLILFDKEMKPRVTLVNGQLELGGRHKICS